MTQALYYNSLHPASELRLWGGKLLCACHHNRVWFLSHFFECCLVSFITGKFDFAITCVKIQNCSNNVNYKNTQQVRKKILNDRKQILSTYRLWSLCQCVFLPLFLASYHSHRISREVDSCTHVVSWSFCTLFARLQNHPSYTQFWTSYVTLTFQDFSNGAVYQWIV